MRLSKMRVAGTRRGVALIMVLILIVLISLGAYTFTTTMVAEERETAMTGRRLQAQAAVASGVEYIKDYVVMAPEDQAVVGGHWDNPNYFKDVPVSEEQDAPRFSIVSIAQDQYGDPTAWRYGLTDEGSKININNLATSDLYKSESDSGEEGQQGEGEEGEAEEGEGGDDQGQGGGDQDGGDQGGGAQPQGGGPGGGDNPGGGPPADVQAGGRGQDDLSEAEGEILDPAQNVLMQLPGMTESIADSILDWIDEDDEPRPTGAEATDYAGLGYEPPNGPIRSLDELLLVNGVTTELLYGADRNHNGLVDEDEQGIAAALGGAEGSMARGWSAYLTVISKDYVEQGEEPIDINGDDLEAIYDDLIAAGFSEDLATYIVSFRQKGAYTPPEIPEDAPDDFELPVIESVSGREPSFDSGGDAKFSSVLDIIGTATQAKFADGEDGEETIVSSPYAEDADVSQLLPELMANLTTGDSGGSGRVSTNHCSSPVLAGIPGMDFSSVQNVLLSQDPGNATGDPNYLYPTWPLATGAVNLEQMKALLPYVSGTGTVFRAQVIAYSDVPGVYARAEVVIDASGDLPKVVSWRDLSHLGIGFDPETLNLQ